MANAVFNVAKGSVGEFARDDATKFGVLLLKVAPADASLKDFDTVAAMLAGGATEADFTNYARKTPLTATRTVNDTSERVNCDLADQTWTSAGGASNNTLVKAVVFYEESASDAGRIPCTFHDFNETTAGNNLVLQFHANGFYQAED